MNEGKPFDPWFHLASPTPAKTVREVELNRLLSLALPYLTAMLANDTGDKLAQLVEDIARETA